MKTLITLVFFTFLGSYLMAQYNIVNVDFELDGKQSAYEKATVKFIYNKDIINVKIEQGNLMIPTSVIKQKATVVFYIDNYVLKFSSIPITWNSLNPKWTVGVDIPPFNKEKFRTVKSWKKVKIIYYLKNEDGRTFTVDDCKKSKVIRN